jgi:hypothetical protein
MSSSSTIKQLIKLLLFIQAITFFSCKKESIPILSLPAITQTGQNTLGFMLNNKVWANYGRRCVLFGGCTVNEVTAEREKRNLDYQLGISAGYNADTLDQALYIVTSNIYSTGDYKLDSSSNHRIRFLAGGNKSNKEYFNRLPNKCLLTITKFDTINKIISGTFNATLYESLDIKDSIKIESGRFDAKIINR